jgi:hypothetical protein
MQHTATHTITLQGGMGQQGLQLLLLLLLLVLLVKRVICCISSHPW